MQKSTKIIIVAVAGLAVIGGAAFAQKGWRHGSGGHGPMGFEQMSERYDANKDGKISQEEIDGNRTSWLGEFDADKSSSLALAEFQNLWLKARNQQMVVSSSNLTGMATARSPWTNTSSAVPNRGQNGPRQGNALSDDELSPRRHWAKSTMKNARRRRRQG